MGIGKVPDTFIDTLSEKFRLKSVDLENRSEACIFYEFSMGEFVEVDEILPSLKIGIQQAQCLIFFKCSAVQ
jgi:hypothetical protein